MKRNANFATVAFGICMALVLAAEAGAAAPGSTGDNAPAAPKVNDLPIKQSVSQYGITWTFAKPARVGQFVTGDYYVVGPVTVKAIHPAPADGVHGSMLNPQPSEHQGYAARNAVTDGKPDRIYKAKLTAVPPVRMRPGDSLVSTITMDNGKTGRGVRLYGRHRGGVAEQRSNGECRVYSVYADRAYADVVGELKSERHRLQADVGDERYHLDLD